MQLKKKFQIFISSTYLDLVDERQAAVQAILKLGHIPAGMELFKAGASQWQTITRWIDESDIYLLILGGRYGTLNKIEDKSYTQLEYEYALSKGIPVFALVLTDNFLVKKEKNKKDKKLEIYESENKEKYESFKKFVLSKIVEFVDDEKDIKLAISNNIIEIADNKNLIGWTKGDDIENSIIALRENNRLIKENNKLKEKINNLKEEILNLKKNKEIIFKCGLTFNELLDNLKNKKITVPEGKLNNKDKVETNLLELSLKCKDKIAAGVSNNGLSSPITVYIYYNIAAKLASYELCDVKNTAGKVWSTIILNSEGKRFFSLCENFLKS